MRKEILKIEKDKFILHVISDLTPYLRKNYEEKKLIGKGFSKKRTWRKIGSIPLDFLLSLPKEQQEEIMRDPRAIKKILKKHPEFRCSEGEI